MCPNFWASKKRISIVGTKILPLISVLLVKTSHAPSMQMISHLRSLTRRTLNWFGKVPSLITACTFFLYWWLAECTRLEKIIFLAIPFIRSQTGSAKYFFYLTGLCYTCENTQSFCDYKHYKKKLLNNARLPLILLSMDCMRRILSRNWYTFTAKL